MTYFYHYISIACLIFTFLYMPVAQAEIPFMQAKGIYEGTKDEFKHLSPLWALIAIHGKLLNIILFFGPFKQVTKNIKRRDLSIQTTTSDFPLKDDDFIAELLLQLFPSPDGVQLVSNLRENEPAGNLSRDLGLIDGIIKILLSNEKDHQKIIAIGGDAKKSSKGLLPVFDNFPHMKHMNAQFAKLLVNAYSQQKSLANPKIPEKKLYPENIVVMALLSFFIKVADDKSELKSLKFLMKDDFDAHSSFSKQDYFQYNKEISKGHLDYKNDPGFAFFMTKGFEVYERLFTDPVTYQLNTEHFTGQGFPDCGETSLRNFFALNLSAGKAGIIEPEAIHALRDKIIEYNPDLDIDSHEPFEKMMAFFTEYPDLSLAATKSSHSDWAKAIGDLNKGFMKSPNDVCYVDRGNDIPSFQIAPNLHLQAKGIVNMLNVIAKLIPDQALSALWGGTAKERYKQVAAKLYRLCNLFSSKDLVLSWEIAGGDRNSISEEFLKVIFKANGNPAFTWEFMKNHFALQTIASSEPDWRDQYAGRDDFQNDWMASLFKKSFFKGGLKPDLKYIPLTLIYNAGLNEINKVIDIMEFIETNNLTVYKPLVGRWIKKSMRISNGDFSVSKLVQFLFRMFVEPRLDELKEPNDIHQVLKYRAAMREYNLDEYLSHVDFELLNSIMTSGNIPILSYIFSQKLFDINLLGLSGTLLHKAVYSEKIHMVEFLLKMGADLKVENTDGETPLFEAFRRAQGNCVRHLAGVYKEDQRKLIESNEAYDIKPLISFLIEHDANINAVDNDGCTVFCAALKAENIPLMRIFFKDYKAEVDLQNYSGFTPLGHAIKMRSINIVRVLINEFHADVNACDSKTSLLHWAVYNCSNDGGFKERLGSIHLGIVSLLVENGADPSLKDEFDRTVMDYLEEYPFHSDKFKNDIRDILLNNK